MRRLRRTSLRFRRRGSALLIVLALLSLLVLLSATLAFTSRIEAASSKNFAKAVQNKTSALTGVQAAALRASQQLPPGAFGTADLAFGGAALQAEKGAQGDKQGILTETAFVQFADAAARLNLNTAGAGQLAAYFAAVSRATGIGVDAEGLAKAVVARRYGPDGKPGAAKVDDNRSGAAAEPADATVPPDLDERQAAACVVRQDKALAAAIQSGVDEPSEFVADIRYPAFGDDERFQSVAELLELPGASPEFVAAAEPGLTVFSISQEARTVDGAERDLVDLNRATVQEIYDALADEFRGEKDDLLLRQFAANIADARDADSLPTALDDGRGGLVVGVERVPVLTEIFPRAPELGRSNDGIFAEIYNPWPAPMPLQGWTIRAAGRTYPLQGTLPPNGYLVVTNNYDNARTDVSPTDPTKSSLYDLFGAVSNGSTRRVLEILSFDLPAEKGTHAIELLDNAGNVADRFAYTISDDELPLFSSFQRINPVVREAVLQKANPFTRPPADAGDAAVATRIAQIPQDAVFTSVLQLFDVFAGFADANGKSPERWAFPVPSVPTAATAGELRSLSGSSARIDARIIDIFTIEPLERQGREEIAADMADADGDKKLKSAPDPWSDSLPISSAEAQATGEAADLLEAVAWARFAAGPRGLRHGLVNVNTADAAVLEAAGFSQLQASGIAQRRRAAEDAAARKGTAGAGALYRRLSEVLADDVLWGTSTAAQGCDRLSEFAPVFDRLTVTSRSFILDGQALSGADAATAGSKVRAVVAMEKGLPELVSWRFAP